MVGRFGRGCALVAVVIVADTAQAQLTTTDLNTITPQDMVDALVGPGVTVLNVTYTGANVAAGTFSGGTGIIGFESGIVLGSGNIADVPGPNDADDTTTVNGQPGDPALTLLAGAPTTDAAVLQFEFMCENVQNITFEYVFTSEEYNEFVNSAFNDPFAFFVNGQNVAVLPDNVTPVTINNVNCGNPYNPPSGGSFCSLFINNDCSDIPPGTFPCAGNRNTEMDGLTVVLTVSAPINPGFNTIRIAIADAGDSALDSNVFIRGESFTCGFPAGAARTSATEKGSLLIFPKVDLCFSATGALLQDTFIDIANDFPADVKVKMYFVNGDREILSPFGTVIEPGWNWVDNLIELTANEPTYWSVASGLPKGVSPFIVLDPGPPPGRPVHVGGGVVKFQLRGFVIAFAVDPLGRQIRWNHLKGDACIVNYEAQSAWEYNAYSFQALLGANGDPLPNPGVINLNGIEYAMGFDQLLMDFYAVGSAAFSGPGTLAILNTDLTLLPISGDFRQETEGPITTKASFDIWNMNEVKFSGTDLCVTCWDQRLLSEYGLPNHFLLVNLQTDKGRARIDGLASPVVCPVMAGFTASQAASLLGVVMKEITFDGGAIARAGTNLHGIGAEPGVIFYDFNGGPPPENAGIARNSAPDARDFPPRPNDRQSIP